MSVGEADADGCHSSGFLVHYGRWLVRATVSAETQRQTWQQSRPSPGDPLTPESIRWEQCNTRHLQQGYGFYEALSFAPDTAVEDSLSEVNCFAASFKVKIISYFTLENIRWHKHDLNHIH